MRWYRNHLGFTQWALALLCCSCVEEGGTPSSSETPLADDLPDTVSSADTPPDGGGEFQAPQPAADTATNVERLDASPQQTSK